MGLRTVLLTGDNEKTANAINRIVKFDEVISGVLPDEKEAYIRSFQRDGKTTILGNSQRDINIFLRITFFEKILFYRMTHQNFHLYHGICHYCIQQDENNRRYPLHISR